MYRENPFFRPGGTLEPGAECYIARKADKQLLTALVSGEYVFVLDSRQKGKSSLVARTIESLREAGVRPVKLDLQRIGSNVTPEQWYAGLAVGIGQELGLREEVLKYWRDTQAIGPLARFVGVLQDVVLACVPEPLVIFIDEVDFVRALDFSTDEFFAAIRECYNRRSSDASLKRITFCLVGVATPGQLIANPDVSPFNIGVRIEMTDFSLEETSIYAKSLDSTARDGSKLVERVHHWVAGHPYLTQLLCSRIAEDSSVTTIGGVDRLVEAMFFAPESRQDEPNLSDVERRLLDPDVPGMSPEERRIQVLELYGRMLKSQKVDATEQNPVVATMKLSGVGRKEQGTLGVRNRVYRSVFNEGWRRQSLPDAELRRQRGAARVAVLRTSAVAAVALFGIGAVALGFLRLSNDRKQALSALEKSSEELKRQNYIGKIASIRLALATNRWMRAADLVDQTKDDPYRGWEWGHVALLVNQDITEYQLPRDTILEPSDHDTMLAIAPDAAYEVRADGVNLTQRFATISVPQFRRGDLRVDVDREQDTAVIRRVDTGRVVKKFSAQASVFDVDPTHETCLVAKQSPPQILYIQSLEGEKSLASFVGPGTFLTARFLPDGTVLSVHARGRLVHWDQSGNMISSAICVQSKNAEEVSACALSPDGSTYTVWGDRYQQIEMRRTSDHGIVSVVAGPPTLVASMAFSPDGRELLVGGIDGVVNLFEVKTGRLVQAYPGHRNPLESVAFFSSGNRFASIDVQGNVRVWPRFRKESVETFRDQTGQLRGGGVSKDGKFLTSVTSDGTILSRDTASGKVTRRSFPGRNPMMQIRPINDDRTVVGFADGHLEVLNGQTLKPEVSGHIQTGDIEWLGPYYGGRRILVQGVDNKYAIVDRKTLKVQARFELKQPSGFKEFGKAGRYIAFQMPREVAMNSGTDGKPMRRWLLGSSDQNPAPGVDTKFIEASPNDEFTHMAKSPDGRYLAVSVGDSLAPDRILLLDTESSVEPIELGRTRVAHLQYSPKVDLLAVFSWDGALSFWNVEKRAEVAKVPTGSKVYTLGFSPDGDRFITNGTSHDTSIWDTRTFKEVMTVEYLQSDPKAEAGSRRGDYASFSADGRDVIMYCTDGTVRTFHSLPWNDQSKTERK